MTRKLKNALTRLVDAAKHLNIEPTILEKWEFPLETTHAHLAFRMDNGSNKSFLALRWRHDDSLGPTKDRAQRSPKPMGCEAYLRSLNNLGSSVATCRAQQTPAVAKLTKLSHLDPWRKRIGLKSPR
ncbi:hypothetical protein [Rhizobium leguminosarum]|uniref:hypothetical protein n=1 Tax=Rhizobium leguminosarum TaxID=384 RepID=UPI00049094DC|nr:hypothetical protein [Rhizobium leguminosarum]